MLTVVFPEANKYMFRSLGFMLPSIVFTLILLLVDLFRSMPRWSRRTFVFLGGLSLEIYLVHDHFVMVYLIPYHLGYWPTMLLTTILTLPLAWALQQIIKRLLPV